MLFDQFSLKDITLRNRIAVSPMCTYSAIDGVINDWHVEHLGALARGGSSLVMVEATAISPDGRITHGCTGLWNDKQTEAFARAVKAIELHGAVPGIQIGHAGRKASAHRPWEGDDHIPENDPRSWEIISPSAIAFGAHLPRVPRAMTIDDIERVKVDFVAAAKRALDAGFKLLELHFAHGLLAHSFFSHYSNQRDDRYGGSAENRMRFLIETFEAVRAVWPENLPLTARLGVTEFDGRDETFEESLDLIGRLKTRGLDLIDVSIGFSIPHTQIPWSVSATIAPLAKRVRQEMGIATASSWNISTPAVAEKVLKDGDVDIVMVGRRLLENPHWPYEAAQALGVEKAAWTLPAPYAHWLERYRAA